MCTLKPPRMLTVWSRGSVGKGSCPLRMPGRDPGVNGRKHQGGLGESMGAGAGATTRPQPLALPLALGETVLRGGLCWSLTWEGCTRGHPRKEGVRGALILRASQVGRADAESVFEDGDGADGQCYRVDSYCPRRHAEGLEQCGVRRTWGRLATISASVTWRAEGRLAWSWPGGWTHSLSQPGGPGSCVPSAGGFEP